MGYTNGEPKPKLEVEKGEKGERGIGFSLTPDEHYHIQNKRITNVKAPVDNGDATNKKYVTDLLKNKAGTIYVNNELSKKANIIDVQNLLGDKLEASDLNIINNTLLVHQNTKAEKIYVDNELAGKVNLTDFNAALNMKGNASDITALSHIVNSLIQNKTDTADFNALVQNVNNYITFPKPKVIIYAEENGPLSYNAFEWSFGNGATGQNFGYPIPISSRILYGAISSSLNNNPPGNIVVAVVVNGNEVGNSYYITKPSGQFSATAVFNPPLELNPGDRVNFRSKSAGNFTHTFFNIKRLCKVNIKRLCKVICCRKNE